MLHNSLNPSKSYFMNLKHKFSCSTASLLSLFRPHDSQVCTKPVLKFWSQTRVRQLGAALDNSSKQSAANNVPNLRRVQSNPVFVSNHVSQNCVGVEQLRLSGGSRHFSHVASSLTGAARDKSSFSKPAFRNFSASATNSRYVIANTQYARSFELSHKKLMANKSLSLN